MGSGEWSCSISQITGKHEHDKQSQGDHHPCFARHVATIDCWEVWLRPVLWLGQSYQTQLLSFNDFRGKDESHSSVSLLILVRIFCIEHLHCSDQCCFPSYTTGTVDWSTCQLYYQLHPASTCTGYRPPAIGKNNSCLWLDADNRD